MVKKNNYFTCFVFFCSFTFLVWGEMNILPRSRSRSEEMNILPRCRSRVFLAPWSWRRSRSKKKYQEAEPEPLGKKIRSRSRLKKKSGAGAPKKFAGSPALQFFLIFSLKDIILMRCLLLIYELIIHV